MRMIPEKEGQKPAFKKKPGARNGPLKYQIIISNENKLIDFNRNLLPSIVI